MAKYLRYLKVTKYLMFVFLLCISTALFFGCSGSDGADGTNAVNSCTTDCHSATSALGLKILEAQGQWEESTHAKGLHVPIVGDLNAVTYSLLGWEWEGSDAYYANGGGCQVCHTGEGMMKRFENQYADSAAVAADYIADPSPIGCFACHDPHTNGDLTLRVPNNTSITTYAGGVYSKADSNICAQCHQARMSDETSALNLAITKVKAGFTASSSSILPRWGYPHYGVQTDMLLGTGGAQTTGNNYAVNSNHTTNAGATCIQCHMTLTETARISLSPGVGGHSFQMSGIVHGAEKGNTTGCKATDCHSGATTSTQSSQDGWLRTGDIVFKKATTDTTQSDINTMLKLFANPASNCDGLLRSAWVALTGGTLTMDAGNPYTGKIGRCEITGTTGSVAADAAATESTTAVKFFMGWWNYIFVAADQSMGIHNTGYAKALLYDACTLLNQVAGSAVDCTAGTGYVRP